MCSKTEEVIKKIVLAVEFLWVEQLWQMFKATDIVVITAIFCSKFI